MTNNVTRAKELLPSIVLTILSMIQALALELFWSKIEESEYLWHAGTAALIGWLQLTVILVGMLLVWVFYVSFVLRFSWLPSVEDALLPFLIGLLEFAMIDLMGPGYLHIWFVLLGAVFGVATAASHLTLRQARRDPENDYFFTKVDPASWRDYRSSVVVVAVLCTFGLLLHVFDESPGLVVITLLLALLALCHRFLVARSYWMHSMLPEAEKHGDSC